MTTTQQHEIVRLVDLVLMGSGDWLLASPFTLGYERVPLVGSDLVSGRPALAFTALSFWGGRALAPCVILVAGSWLVFAPVLFWAHERSAYAYDTLLGAHYLHPEK